MSHPPTPGHEPKISSPKPVAPEAQGGSIGFGISLNTSGAQRVEYYSTYPPAVQAIRTLDRHFGSSQPSQESPSQTTSRALGVHNILNPSEGDVTEPQRPPPLANAPNYHHVPSASPRSRKRPAPASPVREYEEILHPGSGRRVLTPKSPGQRAASLGSRNPTYHHGAGISVNQAPIGLEAHVYTAEPGTAEVPALPSLSSTGRTSIASIAGLPELPPIRSRTPGQAVGGIGLSFKQSESPSTSHTSLSQPEQVSPAFHYGTAPSGQQQSHGSRYQLSSLSGEFGGGEVVSHGPSDSYQTGYQMTLETDQGPLVVPVELDLQQASKVADEKRKRNAGASARFRARRKEKEKEASQKIADLQQEVREMKQSRDFYRNERDFFRDLAASRLGHGQMPPRPPSPLAQRPSVPPADVHREASEDAMRPRSDSAPSIQRQRTHEYPAAFAPAMQSAPRLLPSPYMPSRTRPPAGQQGLPLPLPSAQQPLPGPFASPRQLPPGPPVPPSLGSRSQSFDPFRKDPFDRSWNPRR